MAIKPKSRAHEDRIKALEKEQNWNDAMIHALMHDCQSLQADVQKITNPRPWWQFWK